MDNFKISQSSFKAFYIPEEKFCPMQWYKKYVLRQRDDQKPTEAQLHGQVFEYKCIGATVSGKVPEIPKVNVKSLKPGSSARKADLLAYLDEKGVSSPENAKNDELKAIIAEMPDEFTEGIPSKAEQDIDAVVDLFKEYDKEHGIKTISVQKRLDNGFWIGDADREATQEVDGERKIQLRDLKFAGTKYEREYMNGWSQPANEAFNRSRKVNGGYLYGFLDSSTLTERIQYMQSLTMYERSIIQAVHYCILYHDLFDVWPQFFFDVYGKSGWSRIRQVIIDQNTVNNHYDAMSVFSEDLQYYLKNGFDYEPKYQACRKCDYAEKCAFFKKFPEVEQTIFDQ